MPRRRRDKLTGEIDELVEESIRSTLRKRLTPHRELPEGVVTIVFTDVEGSTELVRDLGEAEARARLRRHDDVVREVLKEHDGVEVERAGDAFMLAFRSPTRAVAFALALHHRLAGDGDLRVRIGMDTGEVIREEQGYFGRTVFRAARIAERGTGGQVLASEATKVLAQPDAPTTFEDTGEHELTGLPGTHRIFEVRLSDQQR